MMRIWLCCSLMLAALVSLRAQVTVELASEPDYLPGEDLELKVQITNLSGQPIKLGHSADWLTFMVETDKGQLVRRLGEVPVAGELELESSKTAIRRVNLAPYYDLLKPGRYLVTAMLKLPGWTTTTTSRPRSFGITSGVKLWEQEFGVPAATGEQPQVRKYTLQKSLQRTQTKLYVRVTDGLEATILGVFPLGVTLSFSKLERQLDQRNNLHVLFQIGARTFAYVVINPDAKVVLRQTHEINQRSLPTLGLDPNGNLTVVGGVRRPASDDFPPAPQTVKHADAPAQP